MMTADTWIDVWLDALRDRYRNQKLSCLAQTTLSWAVALFCLIYYGALYALDAALASSSSSWSRRRRRGRHHARGLLLPLVTHPQTTTTTKATTTSLSEDIRTQLCRAIGSAAAASETAAWTSSSPALLVAAIRNDLALRRLVSEFMIMMQQQQQKKDLSLYNQLEAIWPDLLRLPCLDNDDDDDEQKDIPSETTSKRSFAVTLVIAAYREKGSSLANTLHHAMHTCQDPSAVQVVLVDAGQNEGLMEADVLLSSLLLRFQQNNQQQQQERRRWGQFKLIPTNGSSGRGPSLNCGAAHAQGRILTFLHADTLLPHHWDQKVIQTFRRRSSRSSSSSSRSDPTDEDRAVLVHASAFRFGHDLLRRGHPCGIGAVQLLGNLRATYMKLPYGDHVISIPRRYFHYLGGFPDQPIMEDYALMDLLRKRARVLPERLHIIDGPSARCSVRRWESFGVAYVTLVNALIVYRYSQCSWTANDVFDYYYKRPHRQKQTLKEKA